MVVTLSAGAEASDAIVTIDGEAVPANAIGTPIVVDPGTHEIVVTEAGTAGYRTRVALAEGGQATIDAPLRPPAPVPSPTPAGAAAHHSDPGRRERRASHARPARERRWGSSR